MKFRKLMMQLGLLLAVVLGVGLIGESTVEAATLPAGVKPVNTASAYYTADSNNNAMYMGSVKPNWSVTTQPKLQAPIAANNLSSTDRITTKTTKIYILVSGRFSMAAGATSKIASIKPVAMLSDSNASSTAGNATPIAAGANMVGSTPTPSFTASSSYYEVDVNLSELFHQLPLSIGFAITYTNSTKTDYLAYARINEDEALETIWKGSDDLLNPQLYINSTMPQQTGGNVKFVRGTDKKVTGVGYPGLNVAVGLTKNGQAAYVSGGVISSSGTFEVDFDDYLDNVTDRGGKYGSIGAVEYNDMGDHAAAAGYVVHVLDITPSEKSLSTDPDTLADLEKENDSDILKWIANKAGVAVSYLGNQYDLNDVTLKSDQTSLATKLSSLAINGSLTVKIGATNSDGVSTDGTSNITLTKSAGVLNFSQVDPSMDFGSVAVPSKETLFAPKTMPKILVHDTQASPSTWYVMAQASDLKSTDGRVLDGHMVYVDANGNKEPMTRAVQVAAGTRDRSTTEDVDATEGWSKTTQTLDNPTSGMYLDALPSIYSGSTSTQYTGTIYWQLTNAPGSVSGQDLSNGWVDDGTGSASSSDATSDSSSEEAGSGSESESGGDQSIPDGSTVGSSSSSSTPVYNAFG